MTNHEKTLIIVKPDAIQRNLVGESISRFEKKGLKIVGVKMVSIEDALLDEHYANIKDKPFYPGVKNFMKLCPVIVMALEGINAVFAVRLIVGPTRAWEANAGTIRGDFSLSTQSNIVHASESVEAGEIEVGRFFSKDEIFEYQKIDADFVYAEHKK
ncbi:MAG: nucleoside-diphosphate kinase [Patescibacteria group bacterium]